MKAVFMSAIGVESKLKERGVKPTVELFSLPIYVYLCKKKIRG